MTTYKIGVFARAIGVSVATLQRWDKTGVLKAYRTPTDYRYYTEQQLRDYLNSTNN